MEKIINKYNEFLANESTTWKCRFTWLGVDGKTPKHTTNIARFINETNAIEDLRGVYNVTDLYKKVDELANKYVSWVQSKGNNYNKKICTDIRNFFVGALGEFFFVELLNEVRCLYTPIPSSNEFKRFDFHYISPMLKNDRDFGLDLVGVANDKPIVIQVKFWNPFGKEKLPMEIFQKADSEGCRNEYINPQDNDNIFLCWLGSEERGFNVIKENKVFKNKIVVIGRTTLDFSINNTNKIFWEYLGVKLEKICADIVQ